MNVHIYDNGGESFDRYTIVLLDYPTRNGLYSALAASEHPFHPQGFGLHVEVKNGPHLGNRIAFESLPPDVQAFVKQDLAP